VRSFLDANGKLWVHCAECERGGNGSDKDKCSAGWQITSVEEPNGCFIGTLLEKLKKDLLLTLTGEYNKGKARQTQIRASIIYLAAEMGLTEDIEAQMEW